MVVSLKSIKDTYVRTDLTARQNDNYGLEQTMNVGTGRGGGGQPNGAADAMRSLIQFDIGGLTGEVESAMLQLSIHSFGGGTGRSEFDIEVHRVTSEWIEGNGSEDNNTTVPGAVGVDPAMGVAWAALDANNQAQPSFDSTIVDTITVQQGADQVGDVVEWDITSLVQQWQTDPSSNFGLVLVDNSSEGSVFKELRFGTREGDLYPEAFSDEVTGPRLSITTSSDNDLDDLIIGLYDADTDTLITLLEEGDIIPENLIADRNVTIVGLVNDGSLLADQVESMQLDLNNGDVIQTENVEPYALFGDRKGDFRGGTLPIGDNTITFDLYSKNKLGGDRLGTVTRNFSITPDANEPGSDDLAVGLYDADTNTLITLLEEGDVISESLIAGRNVTIVALVNDGSLLASEVESMQFNFNNGDVIQTENVEPYALFGDRKGDFRGGTLPIGDNTITFDLYSKNKLGGDRLG
ncbi:MAG: DNRLRE domain-containing protein, partial [Cyanothece sp. SIO2G6]|nr:DNRLRE domain-containing protein [Cyanothece sp. SIO2G6]